MKVVRITEECKVIDRGIETATLEKGKFYIMSDIFFDRVYFTNPNIFGLEVPFKEVYNKYKGQPLDNKKILILRHGGGGDILFMMTGARELKRMYPSMKLGIAIGKQYDPIVKYSMTENIYTLPLKLDIWNNYHYHLIFENLIENNKEAEEFNSYDLFMREMGLDIKKVDPENKIPSITVKDEEIDQAKKEHLFLLSPKKKIGIQIESSSPIRTYPPYHYIKVAKMLTDKGYQVYLFGGENQKNIIDSLIEEIDKVEVYDVSGPNLRKAIVIAKLMDCFIAPDSMFIHIAGAFRIPVIGIYTPFHSGARMRYFKNAIGIDSQVGCSPCWTHGHSPCHKGNPSPCFSTITPELIIEVFEKKIEGELWGR